MIELTLPYPPSVNSYWRSVRVGHTTKVLVSLPGRKFQAAVKEAVLIGRCAKQYAGRLVVDVYLYPADARKRDIDNCLKSLLDALGKAGVYIDDSQIDVLRVRRMQQFAGGKCEVVVKGII
ncbi:RusA family crossover junction endodeoxyribonuclease [Alishewanella sp. 16-MA]|uniref:Crossover junction endodeoxyribonuclease rusA n=1 Tax=Alishewanella maricola TaxID=2795740 RepID=A0ABS8C1K9_9ALTE|nr:RusA family crossover junction endodeoxyribonuclease [Alishewanella maricola]MCB5226218.1 RusA family crossover junction endodeoxyribonuclease [Alishewanella maricola]